MYRNRVARERIEYKYVERLLAAIGEFALHRQPCIARHDVDLRARIPQIGEVSIFIGRDFRDGRIDFVKSKIISRQSVRSDRSDAEADRAYPNRAVARIAR